MAPWHPSINVLEFPNLPMNILCQNDSLQGKMSIAFEAGTKSSIPSQEPVYTSTFLEDKEKKNKVIGTPSQEILKPITSKEKMKIPIREDIQDIKNSEGTTQIIGNNGVK
ncbi:hypothetical protein Fot_04277 [Forsythia ovata]|uniref:Uncharacterized protein n=1 Tax=Forsythia ovata TaxID=205694 RepID=A0ABD1XF49_9LAMI